MVKYLKFYPNQHILGQLGLRSEPKQAQKVAREPTKLGLKLGLT